MLSTTGAWLAVSHHSVGGHNILECQLKIVKKNYQHACCSRIGCDLRDGGGDDAEEEEDQVGREGREVGKD